MDAMDEQHFREHHDIDQEDDQDEVIHECRWFWDRPVPAPQMAWPGDVKMPIEWNMLINDMRSIE